ncbi:MAG: M56 family metallopeptidase [Lachnospiraceae bacterium]|nr:M56 family metallopeptidase [Lachnospiraceae bacterium]
MAIFTAGIFLSLLTFCLINKNLLIRFGYKLLGLFILFTFLRFTFPVDFPFTETIVLPRDISYIILRLRHRLFYLGQQPVSIWFIFECIWLIGAIISILWFFISYFRDNYRIVLYGKELTNASPYKEIVADICKDQNRRNNFRVIGIPNLNIPMIFGVFKPRILLPENIELSYDEAYYIIRHEMTHHFHHDLLLKSLIKFITLIYWWNPFCILLNKQADVIIEMHVDDSLVHSDTEIAFAYMQCLTDYASKTTEKSMFSHTFTLGLLPKEKSDLRKRCYLMLNNQRKSDKSLSVLIGLIVLGIYISSYLFIFEGFRPPEEINMGQPMLSDNWGDIQILNNSDSYFIDNGDGTYDLYSGDMFLETTDSMEGYYPGTPVYTPENNPHNTP